jgi:hypothetical protein
MSYCYDFEKQCVVNDTTKATTIQSTVTTCSDLNPLSLFDPGQAILSVIGKDKNLSDLGWPSHVSDDFVALAPTNYVMAIIFILSTCTVALSVLLRRAEFAIIDELGGPPFLLLLPNHCQAMQAVQNQNPFRIYLLPGYS